MSFFLANVQALKNDIDEKFPAIKAINQARGVSPVQSEIVTRVSHITPFFELSLVLLTTHAIGLYEVTKKFQRYRQ